MIEKLLLATPVAEENWADIATNPWTTATDPYITQLFSGEGWIFYAFLMAVTVTVSYVKTESAAGPIATFLVMGVLLAGMITFASSYYFLVATGIGIGIVLYLLVK